MSGGVDVDDEHEEKTKRVRSARGCKKMKKETHIRLDVLILQIKGMFPDVDTDDGDVCCVVRWLALAG